MDCAVPASLFNAMKRNPMAADLLLIILLLLSFMGWFLTQFDAFSAAWVVAILFALAGIKAWLIAMNFMHLAHASWVWKRGVQAWIVMVTSIIVLITLIF